MFTCTTLTSLKFRRVTLTGEDSSVAATDAFDPPLSAPLLRDLDWNRVQRMSQSTAYRNDPLLRRIRATAAIQRGTRMIKILSAAQVAGHLGGWLPYGFCYRACDIAHVREPQDMTMLRTDGTNNADIAFALRWRAVDPIDFEVPAAPAQHGLVELPTHSRMGAMVIGTGFSFSADDLIPEYVTAGFADLPMPTNTQLLAYLPGGEEVVLYAYQPEQHGWLRMAGPRWRPVLSSLPGVSPDRDYLPCTTPGSAHLVGRVGDEENETVANPPDEFRVRAATTEARIPVTTLSRRAEQAEWRGVLCWVLQRDDNWARLRVTRPDSDALAATGARCYERGVYEAWAPLPELVDHHITDIPYVLKAA